MKETQTQFIKRYLEGKDFSEDDWNFKYNQCAVLCDCEDGGGKGHWAMVSKNQLKDHIELYINLTPKNDGQTNN